MLLLILPSSSLVALSCTKLNVTSYLLLSKAEAVKHMSSWILVFRNNWLSMFLVNCVILLLFAPMMPKTGTICYNGIVHSFVILSTKRLGCPSDPLICMFTTLQEIQHKIWTIYGNSDFAYGGKLNNNLYAVPLQGVGQDTGAAPQIWAIVSNPLLNALQLAGFGFYFHMSLSGTQVQFVGYAFVDDADIGICQETFSIDNTAQAMQKALDLWEGSLCATGGALAPDKAFWYLLNYKLSIGQWSYDSMSHPATLTFCDGYGVTHTMNRLTHTEARKTLGIFLSLDSSDTTQADYLQEKVDNWVSNIRSHNLPKHLVFHAYRTTIDRTLQYPLAVTCLNNRALDKIQSHVLCCTLCGGGMGLDIPLLIRWSSVISRSWRYTFGNSAGSTSCITDCGKPLSSKYHAVSTYLYFSWATQIGTWVKRFSVLALLSLIGEYSNWLMGETYVAICWPA